MDQMKWPGSTIEEAYKLGYEAGAADTTEYETPHADFGKDADLHRRITENDCREAARGWRAPGAPHSQDFRRRAAAYALGAARATRDLIGKES